MSYKDKEKQRAFQNAWIKKRRNDWIMSQGGVCVQCGGTDRLEVDHVDPALKSINPRSLWGMSLTNPRRIAELALCQVLCNSCHSAKTRAFNTKPQQPHGTHNRYDKGCRCDECRSFKTQLRRVQRARKVAA
jgi:5-methylcytosine-specific restriction endonuclease McrA